MGLFLFLSGNCPCSGDVGEAELFAGLEAALMGCSSPEADGAKTPKLLTVSCITIRKIPAQDVIPGVKKKKKKHWKCCLFLLTNAKEQKSNKPLVHAYNQPLFHWRKELSVSLGNSTLVYTHTTATVKKDKQDVVIYLFISSSPKLPGPLHWQWLVCL